MENQVEKNIKILKKSKLFRGLNEYEIEKFLFASDFKITELKRGEALTVEPNKSVFVLDGAVATYENGADGVKTFICLFETGKNIMIPVWEKSTYPTISIEARVKSTVLLLDSNSFFKINSSVLILQNMIQQNIIALLFESSDDIVQRTRANAESVSRNKIIKYLAQLKYEQNNSTVEISLTRQELADHLQMDISTLMRELKNLQSEQRLEYSGKFITLYSDDFDL